MSKRSLSIVAIVALLMTSLALPASARTVITEDTTLAFDHEGLIIIDGDGVVLDCDGHSITGSEYAGVHIKGLTGVTVKNCVIDGFDNGILVEDSRDITLLSNTISGFVYHGISLQLSIGLTVKHNSVSGSGDSLGYVLIDSYHGDITDNVALGDMNRGFSLIFGSGWNVLRGNESHGPGIGFFAGQQVGAENALRDNYASGGDNGFAIGRDSYETVELRENTAVENVTGFEISGTGGHLLAGNVAEDNSAHGFFLYRAYQNVLTDNTSTGNENGFALNFSTHNELRDNTANRNSRGGFDLWDRSSWNELTGNTANMNGLLGFWLVGPTPWQGSQYNVFKENRACHNGVWDAGEPYPSPNVENTFVDNHFCVTALYNVS